MSNSVDNIDDNITSINKKFYGFIAKIAKCAQYAINYIANITLNKNVIELKFKTREL